MSRRSPGPTRLRAAAGRAGSGHAVPSAPERERPAGSQALATLHQPAALAPARLSAGDVLWLQRSAGNQAVLSLLDRDRPVAQQAPQGPADVNVGFNPMDINHRLLIAIDQKQVDFHTMTRHVDFDAVVAALSNLTAAEAQQVMDAYLAHEERTLHNDLFGLGESGFHTDLSHDQLMRIGALLSGTRAGPGASAAEARAAAVNRMELDAHELHMLLQGDLEAPQIERVLTLLRRPEEANSELSGVYTREIHAELRGELMRLGHPATLRASLLLAGNAVLADSIQVGADRAEIVAIDATIARLRDPDGGVKAQAAAFVEIERLRKERKAKVESIEQRLRAAAAEARDDALARGEGAERAQQAATERAGAVAGDAGALATTVGGTDATMVRALVAGDPVGTVAAQIRKLSESDDLTGERLTVALRGLRDEAEAQARRELPRAAPEEVDARARTLAADYFARLRAMHDELAGKDKRLDQLLATTGDEGDERLNQALVQGAGHLEDLDELVMALAGDRKDVAAVERVLRNKSRTQIDELAKLYEERTHKSLRMELMGAAPTLAGEENPEVMGIHLADQGKASGTDRLNLEDYLQRPREEGGLEEVLYIAARAEREYAYTIEHRGATGWWRDTWGNEQRELLDETIGTVRKLHAIYQGSTVIPGWTHTRTAHELIQRLRQARATIRGDRAAYEKATAELRATFQAVAAFALQIALTAVLGPVAELALVGELAEGASVALRVAKLAQTAAVGTASTIGANLAVYGTDYSLAMLKADLLGGMGGALAPAAIDRMVAPYARALASKLGPKVSAEIIGLGKTVASMEGSALAQGQTADLSVEGIGKAVIAGKATHALSGAIGGQRPAGGVAETGTEPAPGSPAAVEAVAPPGEAPAPVEVVAPPPESAGRTERAGVEPEAVEPENVEPAAPPPRAGEVAAEPTQVAETPVGAVLQADDPHHPVEAWKLYRRQIAADPRREVALMWNEATDQWAVVQGGRGSVPTLDAMRAMGWEVKDTSVARHSHPVGSGGQTSEANLLASGRRGDIDMVRQDAAKGEPRPDAYWHAIDVTMADGQPDRTWIFRSPETGLWTVDFPDAGERGGRGRVSFSDPGQYDRWFRNRFGFSPDIPEGPRAGAGPTEPSAPGRDVSPEGLRHELDQAQDRAAAALQGHPEAEEVADLVQRAERLLADPTMQAEAARAIDELNAAIEAREESPMRGTDPGVLEPNAETGLGARVEWEPPAGAPPKPPPTATMETRRQWLKRRLQMHVDEARQRYDDERALRPRQEAAVQRNPRAEARFRGTRIDAMAKASVLQDPDLAEVIHAPDFVPEPDFIDSILPDWFDVTTRQQWQAHLDRYMRTHGPSPRGLLPTNP